MMPKLMPAEVVRDEIGTWTHPDFEKYWEEHLTDVEYPTSEQWQALLDYFGIEVLRVDMENDAPDDILDRYFDLNQLEAMKDWTPTHPTADGWFVLAINHTEDGAAAWFARSTNDSEVHHV